MELQTGDSSNLDFRSGFSSAGKWNVEEIQHVFSTRRETSISNNVSSGKRGGEKVSLALRSRRSPSCFSA